MARTVAPAAALALVGTVATAGLGACNGKGTSADAGADTGATVCPLRPDLTAAAPVCNTIQNNAPHVPFTALNAAPPTPMGGGPIQDGVWSSIEASGYGNVPQTGRSTTIVILGGGTEWLWSGEVLDAAGMPMSPPATFQANASATVSGNTISFTTTCSSTPTSPLPPSLEFSYGGRYFFLALTTASGTSVTTYAPQGGCLGV
jgi:hypothetical protein